MILWSASAPMIMILSWKKDNEMNVKYLEFLLGEQRYIRFNIISRKKQPVIITDATYVLSHNGNELDRGKCEIEDSSMKVFINASETGTMQLEVTYVIPPETRKVRCSVNVS